MKRRMDKRNANVVVVRPDRYVLATGESLDAIRAEVKSLLALPAHAEA